VEWDFALLQEAPPRWREPLARELDAASAIVLTSRNFGAPARAFVAERWPNLIKSNEGGSNQLLVRAPWRIEETKEHLMTRRPERRRMLWARLGGPVPLAVANVHGSVGGVSGAPEQVLRAAEVAASWAGDAPLIFGGDLNLRPSRRPELFDTLATRFELTHPTAHNAIDHLLTRGLEVIEPPRQVTPPMQLSDHDYVTATWGMR
jgi:endonuclease/exonuclease/phosphatase family metal-dependent hydrolase